MPELPEVETVARTLESDVLGKRIMQVECLNPKSWQDELLYTAIGDFTPKILKVGRRGKLLLIYIEPFRVQGQEVYGLAFHLKMSGRLFYYAQPREAEKHTRIVVRLENGESIFFDDARKFGYARFFTDKSDENWKFWKNLAKDPLEMEEQEFIRAVQKNKASIKSVLLKQDIVSGIGNIYADEALFQAGILPQKKACELTVGQLQSLFSCIHNVLEESIAFCGSSIKDYRTARGDVGSFQNKFFVYGREGQNCLVCQSPLEKAVVAGRTTIFCFHCQK